MSNISIFCDGSCQMSTRDGGWAYVVVDNDTLLEEKWGSDKATTNNKMELTALLHALKFAISIDKESTIFTDSQYGCNGYMSWCKSWEKKNWKTSTNKKVENLELWQEIHKLRSPKVVVKWIKGHSTNVWNNYCDSLTRNYE